MKILGRSTTRIIHCFGSFCFFMSPLSYADVESGPRQTDLSRIKAASSCAISSTRGREAESRRAARFSLQDARNILALLVRDVHREYRPLRPETSVITFGQTRKGNPVQVRIQQDAQGALVINLDYYMTAPGGGWILPEEAMPQDRMVKFVPGQDVTFLSQGTTVEICNRSTGDYVEFQRAKRVIGSMRVNQARIVDLGSDLENSNSSHGK